MTENEQKYRLLTVVPRRRGIYLTLDWYVLREFLIKFSLLLLVFIVLFLLGDVFRELKGFLEADASYAIIFKYLLLMLPGNIRFILPIATLLACMWTMATFGKNLEVTAMRASGVSLFRCAWGIFFMGFVLAMVTFFLNEGLVPTTGRAAEHLVNNNTKMYKPKIEPLSYASPDWQRVWFIPLFKPGNSFENVSLKWKRPDSTLKSDWRIKKAEFDRKKGWTFYELEITDYSLDGLLPVGKKNEDVFTLSRRDLRDTPDDFWNSQMKLDELSSVVLWQTVRRNPNLADKIRQQYMTHFYYRLAFPWACVLAVFLGVPLATKNERTGSLLAIITAVGIIVGYLVIAQVFSILGQNGFLPAWLAGLAPTIAFITYGYFKVFYDQN